MATLEKAPTSNFWSTSLNGAINDSVTTITLNSTVGLQAPGRLVINRQDSTGQNTPSAREVISFTGISGSDLTGVTRGADNSTARSHADGSLVESAIVVGNWDTLYDVINEEHDLDGTHDTTKVVDLTTAQTLTNKTLTSPLYQGLIDGWVSANETWTREGDNSFSEPTDATLKYQKGDKIRYKQGGGWKYQYIIGVGAYSGGKTIMTTTGGSDYKFDSGTAITDNYYSKVENPQGFPRTLAYPICTAYTSNQLTSTTNYIVPLNNEYIDTHNMHNTSTNNSRIVVPMDGVYLINAQVFYQHQADGYRQLHIVVNGTDSNFITKNDISSSSSITGRLQNTAIISLTTNDYVEMKFSHNSSSSIDLFTNSTLLSVSKVS